MTNDNIHNKYPFFCFINSYYNLQQVLDLGAENIYIFLSYILPIQY